MGKAIINVSNDFFEMDGKEGDVLYSISGNNCGIKSNSVLYGKTINLSEMYDTMLSDVREFLFGGEFVNIIDKSEGICMSTIVNKYTFNKHGISMEWVYNKMQGNLTVTGMTTDIIFNELKNKYGMTEIDWMYLYNNVNLFVTNDVDILEYVGNRILNNDIHEYFVTEYNLRTVGVVKKVTPRINKNNVMVDRFETHIKLEWNNGCNRVVTLSNLAKSYKHWWRVMTKTKKRSNIRDYDVLLNGRSVK